MFPQRWYHARAMAYTVEAAFDAFYDKINLSGDHRETANKRRDRLVELLKKDFDVLDAFPTGSIPRFTALKSRSDVDVMVVLHYGKHIKDKTPQQLLQAVRDCLGDYETSVRKNGQAVTLSYKTWPSVDIVPVSRTTNSTNAVTHYNVPNMKTGAWLKSRPRSFSATIDSKASLCGGNFRRIIKMAKAWNASHSEYLTGYHIEVMAIQMFASKMDDTAWNTLQFFEAAHRLASSSLWYDESFADEYLSLSDRCEVLKRLETARDKARLAWHATYGLNNDHEKAMGLWRQVFGSDFPAYG